jgi:RND family efflux transporter MFP subunit
MALSHGAETQRARRPWRRLAGVVLGLAVLGIGIWLARRGAHSEEIGPPSAAAGEPSAPTVDVVKPRPGGIARTIQQPASLHSFETVDLYAMVSGYLKSQEVDIGSRVKKGAVLAEINVPRDAKAVDEAAALVEQARAQIAQAEARVTMAGAQRDAAAAAVQVAESDLVRLAARKQFAEKQFARVTGLVAEKAATKLLVDEQQRDLEAATAAERTGHSQVQSTRATLLAAHAAVDQAKADAVEASAALGVAEARLAKARVNLDYAKIRAPFDGVMTRRTFHPGALIHAATEGGNQPLLTVKRTDVMRVVVLVPDRDVVLTHVGNPATVSVDALADQAFTGTLARIARAEDAERLMRVEIDLPNPTGVLCDGMYGKATITLERDTKNLTLPPACVVEHRGRSHGVVYLVRDGLARRTEVKLGVDNGSLVEVLSGIGPDDAVIVHAAAPVEDGLRVTAVAPGIASGDTPAERVSARAPRADRDR